MHPSRALIHSAGIHKVSPQVGLCASLLYDTPLGNGLLKNYTDLQTALAEKRRLELTIDQHHHPSSLWPS